jgi:hypothetical protein
MGFGLWKKIKEGFKKAGRWIRDKIAKPVWNKVIKPVGKFIGKVVAPIAKTIAPIAGAIHPAAGIVAGGVAAGADLIGKVTQNPKDELQPLLKAGYQGIRR